MYDRYLSDTAGGSTNTDSGNTMAYDLGVISIFLMLVFYVISNGVISKYHVKINLIKLFLDRLSPSMFPINSSFNGFELHHLPVCPRQQKGYSDQHCFKRLHL